MAKIDTSFIQSPEQREMYEAMWPLFLKAMSGDPYDIPSISEYAGYNIPSIQEMMPTGNWWENLDPNIRTGIMQPYQEGSKQLGEQLMSYGQGSQMGGASGAMGAGLGRYWADIMPQASLQGWNMVSPALQKSWEAKLDLNKTKAGYGYQTGMAEWEAQLNQNQLPYNLMASMMGSTLPTPVVSEDVPWYASLMPGVGSAATSYGLGKLPF